MGTTMTSATTGKLIDTKALASYLGRSEEYVGRLVKEHGMPCWQEAEGGPRLFHVDVVDEWFAERMRRKAREASALAPKGRGGVSNPPTTTSGAMTKGPDGKYRF